MKTNLLNIWVMVVFSTFFWGSNFNCAQALAGQVTPLTAAAERFLEALIIFLLMRIFWGKSESALSAKDIFILVALGVTGVFGFNYAFFTALHTTTALNGALIMALSPMLSVILSVLLLNAQVQVYQYIGMLIAFVGVVLVITSGHFQHMHLAVGDWLMFFACAVWSIYSVGSKKFAGHIPSQQFARWTVGSGAVALTLAALLIEQPIKTMLQLPTQAHLILFYMGFFGSVLAYLFWLKGIAVLGPDKSAIAFNLVPVFALLVSLVLGKFPSAIQWLGLVLVLLGLIVANRLLNFSRFKN